MTGRTAARLGRRRLLLVGALLALGLVAVGLTAGRAVAGGSGPRYRLATASIGSVDQTLTEVGTVSAVNRVTVSFPVAGTVAGVRVGLGTRVVAGQTLANLAPTALTQQLAAANADLAADKQTLAADEASQTSQAQRTQTQAGQTQTGQAQTGQSAASDSALRTQAGTGTVALSAARSSTVLRLTAAVSTAVGASGAPSTGGAGRSSGVGSSGAGSSGAGSSGAGSIGRLAVAVNVAQQAVLAAQRALDADLAAAEQALTSCQAALTQATPTPSPTPSESSTADPTGSPAPGAGSATGSDTGSAQCLAAIGQAPDKDRVATDQQARAGAESKLDAAIKNLVNAATKAAAGSGSSGGTSKSGGSSGGTSKGSGSSGGTSKGSGSSGGTSKGSGSSGTSGSGTSGRTSSGPASAEQLAADQAQIDAAQAHLAVAQQNLAATVLTSPLDGTVAAVSIAAGKPVGASSSSEGITVIGAGAEQVSTTVGLADIDSVHAGELATARVDGQAMPLTGKVSLVGILNSTSGSGTSYPVTIVLDPSSARLFDGSGASVQIEVAKVSEVLTVPSSAVHALGQLHTVEVLKNGKPAVQPVTIGAVGSARTQIREGLSAGQQVVLADLTEALPGGS
jgi:trimeric autotransporter adhesin